MLSTEEFKAFSTEYVMFCHITTRIPGRADEDLLQKKGGTGFPYLVALDAHGDVIAKAKDRSVAGFRAMMESGAKFVAIQAKPEAERTLDDRVFVFLHDIEMEELDLAAAQAEAAKFEGLSPEQKAQVDGALLGLEIESLLPRTRDREEAKRLALVAGKRFSEMWAEGREPKDEAHIQPFFIVMLDYAESEKDAALFEKALAKLEATFGENPRAKGFFDAQKGRLAKLKAADDGGVEDHHEGDEGGEKDDH